MPSLIETINQIATKYNVAIEVEDTVQDKSVLTAKLTKNNYSLFVTLLKDKASDEYFCYGITADGLPRELYTDSIANGYTLDQRSKEILDNIDKLLSKKITFQNSPKLFNKSAGKIKLKIDGETKEITQKSNVFSLPEQAA